MSDLIEEARRAQKAIYIAVEKTVADDLSRIIGGLADRIESLEAELAGIRERDEEVGTDEGWWIGGAWGDYGEAVVPLRILSYVIDGALDQKVTSIEPGFALTYAEQIARADRAEARLARVADEALMIEHSIIGTQAGKQGASQTVPEDLVVCAKCGWMRGSDYVLHLADAIRAVAADEPPNDLPTQEVAADEQEAGR